MQKFKKIVNEAVDLLAAVFSGKILPFFRHKKTCEVLKTSQV
jgi:hypothetical protein